MIDKELIRQNPNAVADTLLKRGFKVDFKNYLGLEESRRKLLGENEAFRAKRNAVSAQIAQMKKSGENADAVVLEMKKIGDAISNGDVKIAELDEKIFEFLSALPNLPDTDVVSGGKENNKVIKTVGTKPEFKGFTPKNHVELCTSLKLIDYERGAKISGAKAWVYTGMGARLEWALLNYFIDFHVNNGYTFILPPHLLNYESGYAAGQFPKFIDDVFVTDFDSDPKKSKFMLPTAETALISLHRGEIIPESELPIKYAAYSPCYRKEAGSYRTDERGMIRGHQFNKVEMFVYCKAEDADKIFAELVSNAEKLVSGLGLHFQTVALAAGDCSASMAKTYDIEVYIPSMNGYKEVSSASNARDYQARRAGIRTKIGGQNVFVNTLNASGLATSRIIPAIVEQFQTADGRVIVPEVLRKYLGGVEIL
ncbi:MAG: serine--tRNA ligase [Christensenellaceae bacterium]|jgi:seryl-tRNA synthetase|nr:serine--tRNA ligase [Christensenellaceae bacterium]